MTSQLNKPRIHIKRGVWYCGDVQSCMSNWAVGFGDTPKKAFDNWKRTRQSLHKYAIPEQLPVPRA